MKKHFLTYAVAKGNRNRKVVWGTGTSIKRSKAEATNWLEEWGYSRKDKPKLVTTPCDYSVFNYVLLHGGMSVPFRIKNGVAYLDL